MEDKKVLQDRLTADDILREAARLAKDDVLACQQQYEDRAKSIHQVFDIEPDTAFLQFARTYDQQRTQVNVRTESHAEIQKNMQSKVQKEQCSEVPLRKKTAYWMKRFTRFTAVFLICFVSMGGIALGASETLREQVFSLFYNEDAGSVTLRSETEADMIVNWDDYWYPEWLPEGFYMLGARDENNLMVFASENNDCRIRIKEHNLNTSASLDIDTAEIEEITIGDKKVILSIDEANKKMSATWMTESKIIEVNVENDTNKEVLTKIVEKMKYVKKN